MEQDDKASAAALSLSPASSAGNNGRASLRQSEGAPAARSDVEAASGPEQDESSEAGTRASEDDDDDDDKADSTLRRGAGAVDAREPGDQAGRSTPTGARAE